MRSLFTLGALAGAIALAGCQTQPVQQSTEAQAAKVETTAQVAVDPSKPEISAPTFTDPAPKQAPVAEKGTDLFEVHHEGRIYFFYDFPTYQSFLDVGETAFRLTRIAAGPKGETVVFGLTKEDKKKGAETPAALIIDGKAEAKTPFYGEIMKHGRIYVFDSKKDMDFVREVGEPSYMYTEIGSGPNGETVVYVLNKNNKKKKPVALIESFEKLHPKKVQPVAEVVEKGTDLFEVHHEGRIYFFYDFPTYQSFLDVGETAFRLTRIAAGPKGETVVFGLTKEDKKKGAETPAALIIDGKAEAKTPFYGEIMKHGRIYVFDSKKDMDFVREVGEPSYMYTEIGAGPNGETLVFVLNKDNKKKKPVVLIEAFNKMHAK
ncbi:hypothetical protein [Thiomicrorhabdus sp.]|uniref:hypothetical protein n=1 Tax=Thiomicrorhabdus sp. TaxID=2039724 RepID=UPI0029C6CF34|nr:hypothetical protein [Thiomicrorhabdus sp.]